MQTGTVSIEQFVTDNRISMTATSVDRNPNMDSRDMDHWKVTLVRKEVVDVKQRGTWDVTREKIAARMTTYFSMGYGHGGKEPEVADVLDCLSSDAAGIENAQSFEDWCSEYGYDTDSRKAEKTFKACEHSAKRLKNFLGDELYQQLLWHTERL